MSIYYYQFNIGDYRKDTLHLSLLEHGIYRQLIDTYYIKEGKLEADMHNLMRMHSVRNADEIQAFENVIKDFFVEQDGMLMHRGCDKVIAEIYDKSDKAKASAKARWSKENANAKRSNSERNADGMLNNNQEPITNNHKPKNQEIIIKPRSNASIEKPDDIEQSVWDDFLAIRKAKRSPLTKTALIAIQKEAEKAGWCMQQVLQECISRGWQGFKADWVIKNNFNKQETLEIRNRKVVEQYNAELRAKGEI